jgi:hypothetical protein
MSSSGMPFDIHYHERSLQNLCRICAYNNNPRKSSGKPKLCTLYESAILQLFNIDIRQDVKGIHPEYMCMSCYNRIVLAKYKSKDNECYIVANTFDINDLWVSHNDSCKVCQHYQDIQKGCVYKPRRKPVCQKVHIEFDSTQTNIFHTDVPCCDVDKMSDAHTYQMVRLTESQTLMYVCELCSNIFNTSAVKTPCEHYFCSFCLSKKFKEAMKNSIPCPSCTTKVEFQNVKSVDNRFKLQILSLRVKCHTCGEEMSVSSAHSHVCIMEHTPCPSTPPISVNDDNRDKDIHTSPASTLTARSCLSRSVNSPLSKMEERLYTHLTRRKLAYSQQTHIACKTRGQVCIYCTLYQNIHIKIYI